MILSDLGWNSWFAEQYKKKSKNGKLLPARIIAEYAGCYGAETENGTVLLTLSGKVKHFACSPKNMPVVGDWVLFFYENKADKFPIYTVLERKTLLSRAAVGKANEVQPIAANADYVFIVQGLDSNFNLKRLDRYLTAVRGSGVKPIIILNKIDLCPDYLSKKKETEDIVKDIPVFAINSLLGIGYEALFPYVIKGKTLAFIGSSGVGKSTIVNCLGAEKQKVGMLKAKDGKGMHTTTTRRLLMLKNGAMLVDTPGMKEFAAWEANAGFNENFTDIETLALHCKFSNCKHNTEPQCAVIKAVEDGILSIQRLENYRKLKAELLKRQKRHFH